MDCSFQDRHHQVPTVSVLPTFTASYAQPQPQPAVAPGFDCLSEVYGAAAAFGGPNAGDYGGEMGFLDVVEPKTAAALVDGGGGGATAGLGVCKVEPGLAESGGAFGPGPGVARRRRLRRPRRRGSRDAVQEPDGRAPPPQAPQRPPLHAALRRAQDQQGEKAKKNLSFSWFLSSSAKKGHLHQQQTNNLSIYLWRLG
ncbi:unnamed protein product [Miscanthus lutarioriparius]|uniref:Uncharacterized protein n=1 Tax=Miscanthus lutarioriparius TaxID=422564 RepID=A0A811SBW4_9POAL|nr:unnamed protein product [Miscanthus lutarioriparius]